ncbi:eh domain-containing protein 3 [Stylonychia lemnae]|uniref:Eh domain-containing protein 3 n=1 Tax=Stylonychia lemnae TaxID=5949 RepID=A0A078ADT4_STYLE|nr:eh domain-containing protein 3 [Stylonychia lemnae]|eukprot:CDW79068.1 eh domain-containing protein 3 [Stylonychia lemnae]
MSQADQDEEFNDKLMNTVIKQYNYEQWLKQQYTQSIKYQQYVRTSSLDYDPNKLDMEKVSRELYKLSQEKYPQLKNIIVPEKKLVVMILGNHSAGKSSFINWYVEQPDLQKTKVSIETIEINLIMQGNSQQEFNGMNAMQMLPFLRDLYDVDSKKEKFPGLLENLFLKSSNSDAKDFKNIVFIDTPGLADGNLKYKFDVEQVFEWIAAHCDVILTFFDPQGQALCKRTMNMIQQLYKNHQSKLQFIMTKGDMFDSDDDRLKCMCQITQSLSTIIPPMHGFQMPIISLPTPHTRYQGFSNQNNNNKLSQINQIDDIVQLFRKKYQVKGQSIMSKFNEDIKIINEVTQKMKNEQKSIQSNKKPIQLINQGLNYLLKVSYDLIKAEKSLFHFLMKNVMGIAVCLNWFSEKLAIHQNNFNIDRKYKKLQHIMSNRVFARIQNPDSIINNVIDNQFQKELFETSSLDESQLLYKVRLQNQILTRENTLQEQNRYNSRQTQQSIIHRSNQSRSSSRINKKTFKEGATSNESTQLEIEEQKINSKVLFRQKSD